MHSSPWLYLNSHSQAFFIRPAFKNGFIGLVFMYAWICMLFLWQPACHLLPPQPPLLQDEHQPVGFEWWRQLPAEADCALSCVSLIRVSPSKAPGLHNGLPVMVHQPVLSCLGTAPFSTVLISAPELSQQAREPGHPGRGGAALAVWLHSPISSKQGFSLSKSGENSSPGCCYEAGTWHSPSSHLLVHGSC